MFLVMAIEYFADSEPVTSFDIRDRWDDAVMLARCLRDEAKSRGNSAEIDVRRIEHSVKRYVVAARPKRKRRAG
ncbi:MAG: hypothetical protein IT430_13820 [Phycisphaerales bacterium]|nr:hypothetical protein [Phycisphaerales bacterium]